MLFTFNLEYSWYYNFLLSREGKRKDFISVKVAFHSITRVEEFIFLTNCNPDCSTYPSFIKLFHFMFQDCFDRCMFVNYPIKFVIEDKERFIDIISMDRVWVEVLEMMNKCTFREIRLVTIFTWELGITFSLGTLHTKNWAKWSLTSNMTQLPLLILAS